MDTHGSGESKPKLPDGTAAFTAIIKDISIVFHLDYRNATFKRWYQVVGTALDMFLGPLHPRTLEFHSIRFKHPDSPDIPEGKPVTEEDELTFSSGLETTKGILEFALNECRECDESEARRIKRMKEAPAVQAEVPPMEIHIIRNKAPGGGSFHFDIAGTEKTKEEQDVEVPDNPIGGMKIVSRAGTTGANTLEGFIRGIDDPQERDLVIRLREVLDNPGSSWTDVKMVLEEIMDFRRETALHLFPIIIKH